MMFNGSCSIIIQGGTFIRVISSNIDLSLMEEIGVNVYHKNSAIGSESNSNTTSQRPTIDHFEFSSIDTQEANGQEFYTTPTITSEVKSWETVSASRSRSQQDSADSTSNLNTTTTTTPGSFHDCSSSIITHVQSQRIVVDDDEGALDEIKEGSLSQIEEIENAQDVPANNNDGDTTSSPIHRTYQFDNCHVYINSFNPHGVKVNNSGNYAPRVTHHRGTALTGNEDLNPSSSSKISPSELNSSIRLNRRSEVLLREDNSPIQVSAPPVGVDDVPFEHKKSTKTRRDKLPPTVTVDAKLMQSNPAPSGTTLPRPKSQPHPINPFLPIHTTMGLHPNFLSHILQPFRVSDDDAPNKNTANDWIDLSSDSSTNLHPHHYPATSHSESSSLHHPDTNTNLNSKSLEHHLDSALAILIQTSGRMLADGVSPQARNTLKAINALVSPT